MRTAFAAFIALIVVVVVVRYWVPITLVIALFIAAKLLVRYSRRTPRVSVQTPPPVIPKHTAPKLASRSPECLTDEHLFCEDKRCGCPCGHDTHKIVQHNESKYELDECPF
jgi:hypothetical protein